MKTFVAMTVTGVSLLILVIGLDMFYHNNLKHAVINAVDPFRVVDMSEYIIIGSFVLYYLIKGLKISFQNRAKKSSN